DFFLASCFEKALLAIFLAIFLATFSCYLAAFFHSSSCYFTVLKQFTPLHSCLLLLDLIA
ncbi:hypothetical protein Tco_1035622, partial [Tanacetum coccineum]